MLRNWDNLLMHVVSNYVCNPQRTSCPPRITMLEAVVLLCVACSTKCNFVCTNTITNKYKYINKASSYILGNLKLVYQHQVSYSQSTHNAKRLSENSWKIQAVLVVDRIVEQLWPHVHCHRLSHNCSWKKINVVFLRISKRILVSLIISNKIM
jgi:hypothetical protein